MPSPIVVADWTLCNDCRPFNFPLCGDCVCVDRVAEKVRAKEVADKVCRPSSPKDLGSVFTTQTTQLLPLPRPLPLKLFTPTRLLLTMWSRLPQSVMQQNRSVCLARKWKGERTFPSIVLSHVLSVFLFPGGRRQESQGRCRQAGGRTESATRARRGAATESRGRASSAASTVRPRSDGCRYGCESLEGVDAELARLDARSCFSNTLE